jgi:hypothetical protein
MPEAQQDRLAAIRRYLQGEPASVICRAVGRSRYWLYNLYPRAIGQAVTQEWHQSRALLQAVGQHAAVVID